MQPVALQRLTQQLYQLTLLQVSSLILATSRSASGKKRKEEKKKKDTKYLIMWSAMHT